MTGSANPSDRSFACSAGLLSVILARSNVPGGLVGSRGYPSVTEIGRKISLTPIAILRHGRERTIRGVVENRLMNMAKAILDAGHHIPLQLLSALLSPCFLFHKLHQSEKILCDS
jgi:hypothetical protein